MPEQVGDRQDGSRQDERGAGARPSARRDDAVAVPQSPGGEAIPNCFLRTQRGSFAACTSLDTPCSRSKGLIRRETHLNNPPQTQGEPGRGAAPRQPCPNGLRVEAARAPVSPQPQGPDRNAVPMRWSWAESRQEARGMLPQDAARTRGRRKTEHKSPVPGGLDQAGNQLLDPRSRRLQSK